MIYRIILVLLYFMCGVVAGVMLEQKNEPIVEPIQLNQHVISMPENCFTQLENSDMIQIKIIKR